MSRIFDALQKSGQEFEEQPFFAAKAPTEADESTWAQSAAVRARVDGASRLVVYTEPQSLGAERFRVLRAQLNQQQRAGKFKTILLTSALPQEGKTVVAANLAAALAVDPRQKVLVLECDLRRPSLRAILRLENWPGLSHCLESGSDPFSALRRIEPLGFYLLPAGEVPSNPVELLQSPRFSETVKKLSLQFDTILIDSPPVSPLADTTVLKAHCDGALLVVRAGWTPRPAVEEAIQVLGPEYVIGVVLNAASGLERNYSHYYHYQSPANGGRNGSGSDPAIPPRA